MSYNKLKVTETSGKRHVFTFSPDYLWQDLIKNLVKGGIKSYVLIRNGVTVDEVNYDSSIN